MSPLIVHVIPTLAPYGAERIAVELASRLPERGFRTRLVVLFDGDGGPLWREVRARDIRWSLLGTRDGSRMKIIRALRKLFQEEGERAPAVVHTHLFGGDFWSAIAHLGIPALAPVMVSTAHNVDRDDSSVRRAARAWSVRRSDAVVAISSDVERYVRQDLGVMPERIHLIPNGMDGSRIQHRGARPFHHPAHLLMVGRLEPQKGHETVLRALASVPAEWKLSLVGTGSLERHLKELAEKLGVMSRVHFLGERQDIPARLADADLFLFPSHWEGMGLALLEAIAAGVPTLASDLPATRDLLPRAALIDPERVPAWTRAISAALSDPAALHDRTARLASTIQKRYDIETMVDRYADLYRQLLPS